jgi:hypothetical protein
LNLICYQLNFQDKFWKGVIWRAKTTFFCPPVFGLTGGQNMLLLFFARQSLNFEVKLASMVFFVCPPVLVDTGEYKRSR